MGSTPAPISLSCLCWVTQTGLLKLENCLNFLKKSSQMKSSWNFQQRAEAQPWISIVIFMISHRSTPREMNSSLSRLHCASLPEAQKLTRSSTQCGCCGHAFESWTSPERGKMWLKDFRPNDVKGIRIMSYGYNASLYNETTDIDFLNLRKHLLRMLGNARRSTPVCISLDPPAIDPSMFGSWTNTIASKSKETPTDIYWTWGWRDLDPSGKTAQFSCSMIGPGFRTPGGITMNIDLYLILLNRPAV
jgi:hypothetical protein